MTHVQFVLLASTWWLNERGRRPTQVELAAQARTDVKMTSQVVRSLEAKGLLEREVGSATLARDVSVSRGGARLAPRAIAAVERADGEFFGDVDALAVLRALARG